MTQSPENGTVPCPACGRGFPAGAKFCGFDGTILPGSEAAAPADSERDNRICPLCQTTYPNYARYCSIDAAELKLLRSTSDSRTGTRQLLTSGDVLQGLSGDDQVPVTELLGHVIGGKYRLEEFIGEGGMAVVYRAQHVSMERPVVIKILQGRLLANEKSVQRFERECKLTARVSHPNVVSVFDVGFVNGNQPYLVMEYIRGESLRDKIEREGPMPLSMTAAILVQVLRGLQEAHSLGVVHRDLKPENILLQERGDRPDWVKIVDFGIAHLEAGGLQRLTKTGSVVGTAEYMAPEQLKDSPIDPRSDLYSVGVILFEMLTSRIPFDAETLEAMLLKIIMDPPELPSRYRADVPPGSPFDRLVARALEKDPDRRYQTATEMRLDLEHVQHELMLRRAN